MGLLLVFCPWFKGIYKRVQSYLYPQSHSSGHFAPVLVSTAVPASNENTVSPSFSNVGSPTVSQSLAPIFAPVINIGNIGNVGQPAEFVHEIKQEPRRESISSARLELNFELLSLTYKLERCAWERATQFDNDRQDAIVAWFGNPVPLKGMSGVQASKLSAHIRYSVEGRWTEQISRGYWLDCSANEISIDVADRAGLIIGLNGWSYLASYENPYSRSAGYEILQPALRHPGKKVEMPKAPMDIEISLLSQGTTTLDRWKCHLTFVNNRPFAVKVT